MVVILIGIFFFGGGGFTSSSEFYYLTLVAGRLQCVYRRLGDHSAQENYVLSLDFGGGLIFVKMLVLRMHRDNVN